MYSWWRGWRGRRTWPKCRWTAYASPCGVRTRGGTGAVAARWGFTDPTHFSRLFRTVYGMPPRDFGSLSSQACADRQLPCAD
nr:AraC family transcriptional regulator [Streptomyces aurantiacus]